MLNKFRSRLNYSLGNEDWRTEKEALCIKSTDHVLCVTASGDRPLNLLTTPCKITAIDINLFQNELLRLKCAAIQSLEYEEYLGFLGANSSNNRDAYYAQVSAYLNAHSIRFWQDKQKKIRKGILYQGRVEKITKGIAKVANVMMPQLKKLFEIDNLEEQRVFIEKEWNTFFLRKAFDIMLSRSMMKLLAFDPGLYSYLPPNMRLGTYLFTRMHHSLTHCLAKDNIIFSLVFRGFVEQSGLPLYLQADGFKSIKNHLAHLSIETGDLIQHLNEISPNSYDCFSLSDVASYMDQTAFNQMIHGIYHAAKPGARFCIRQFSSDHQIPTALKDLFVRDTDLEKKLEEKDTCFLYRFIVGTILK